MEVPCYQTQSSITPLRARNVSTRDANQPEVDWRYVAIAWLLVAPQPGRDEEAAYIALGQHMAQAYAIAEEEEVCILRRPGGLVLVAGTPIMHEDDVERIVRAAWRLTHAIGRDFDGSQTIFAVQTGVSCGNAIASCAKTEDDSEIAVFGPPWDEALALARQASRGQIWVSEEIARVCRDAFAFNHGRDDALNSPAEPINPACQLLAPLPNQRADRLQPNMKPPLTGRDDELMRLHQYVQSLPPGQGSNIRIVGEAGIGKTRFLHEAGDLLESDGMQVLRGECLARRRTQAFAMFGSLLSYLLKLPKDQTEDSIRTLIERSVSDYLDGSKLGILIVQMIVGLRPTDDGLAHLRGLAPEQIQHEMFSTVYKIMAQLAAKKPLVLLLDDVQWIDPWSGELLEFLSSLIEGSPIIFVCAERTNWETPDDGFDREFDPLRDVQGLRIRLNSLSSLEAGRLLDRLTVVPLPHELRTYIVESSGGNPCHLEAFFRMLTETGDLQWNGKSWRLVAAPDLQPLRLPRSLESVIRSRIARLQKQERDLLRYAAVLGQPLTSRYLLTLTELSSVAASLKELHARGLLLYDDSTHCWRISHNSVEKVIYQSLLRSQRCKLHLRIAEALVATWNENREPHAGEIAHHYRQAGQFVEALEHFVVAGEWAARVRGTHEAISHFEQASDLITRLPETAVELRWRVFAGLGDAYRIAGEYRSSEGSLTSGLSLVRDAAVSPFYTAALLRRMGETRQAEGRLDSARTYFLHALTLQDTATNPAEHAEHFYCRLRIADTYFMQGDLQSASNEAHEALILAQQSLGRTEIAQAYNLLGGIAYRHGDLESSQSSALASLHTFQAIGAGWGVARAENNLGIVAVAAGRWSEASLHFSTSLRLSQELGNLAGIVIANQNLGLLHRDQGRLEEAADYLAAGLKIAEASHMDYHIISLTLGMTQTMLMRGEVDEAADLLQRGKKQAHAVGTRDLEAEAIYVESEYWYARTDWSRAEQLAQHVAALAAEIDHRRIAAAAWRLATRCALATGNVVRANQFHAKAEAALAQTSDRLEHGRIVFQAALLHRAENNQAEAQRCLVEAHAVFASLGAQRDLHDVERLQALVSTQSI
ncbi:MAG: tetratricopeptide repeat protein [Anaerolineae bacterium]|nr:tetratricopeptide repeat protein [Anaerolineae bacterium]